MLIVWLMILICGLISYFLKEYSFFAQNIEVYSWGIITIVSIGLFLFLVQTMKNRHVYMAILLGYYFRVFLLVWDIYFKDVWSLPNSGMDSEIYHLRAIQGLINIEVVKQNKYSLMLTGIYKMFGEQRIIAQYINILLGISSIIILYKILDVIKIEKRVKILIITVASLLPNFAIMNSILLRESIIIFLLATSLYLFLVWWEKNKKFDLIVSILLILFAMTFHSGAMTPLVGYIVCIIFYDKKNKKFKFTKKSIFMLIICSFSIMAITQLYGEQIFGKFSRAENISDITEHVEESSGGSGYEVGISTGNAVLDMIINTPVRIIYFIASPLPWNWRGIGDIIAFFFSALLYIYCYFITINTLKKKNVSNKNLIIIFLTLALSSAFVFAWGVSNAGTALRHRDKFVIQYLVMLALGLHSLKNNKYIKTERRKICH